MKKVSAILVLLLISSSVFAANDIGKTVTCSSSVSGGGLRGEAGLEPKSTVLSVQNEAMQYGSILLQITPEKKLKIDINLYTGPAGQSLDLTINIKGTEITASGRETTANFALRDKYNSSIDCSVK